MGEGSLHFLKCVCILQLFNSVDGQALISL